MLKEDKKKIEYIMQLFKKIESLLKIKITLNQKIKIINELKEREKEKEKEKEKETEKGEEDKIANSKDIDIMEIILFNTFKGLFEFIFFNDNKKNSKF